MTTGKQEKIEGEPTGTEQKTTETEEAARTVPYTHEQVDALLAQMKFESEQAIKGLQRTLSKKDLELKELETNLRPITPNTSILKTAIDVLADEGNYDPARVQKLAQLRTQLAEEESLARRDIQIRQQQQIVNFELGKLQQKMTDAGLDPEDDQFDGVMDAFDYARDVTGNFDKAHKRLDKIISKEKKGGTEVASKKSETEGQMRERIERETLEKYGLNKSERATPSGSSGRHFTQDQLADRKFWEANREAIEKAREEGHID